MASHPLVVGLLAAGFDAPYQIGVRSGFEEVISARGGTLVCVSGILRRSSASSDQISGFASSVLGPGSIDALAFLASTFAGNFSSAELGRFLQLFPDIPTVALGMELPGMPWVRIDNYRGMAELVRHLFDDHGYRAPAFIGGPIGHPEPDLRERVFREALVARGIPLDEARVVHTDFEDTQGEQAIRGISAVAPGYDVVVCANDSAACEVRAWIDARPGPRPAVTGFDDIPLASHGAFSLTTVSQPLEEMGRIGAAMLLEALAGRRPPDRVLDTRFVRRTSCGCAERRRAPRALAMPDSARLLAEERLAKDLRMLGIRLQGAFGTDEVFDIMERGLQALELGRSAVVYLPETERPAPAPRGQLVLLHLPGDPPRAGERHRPGELGPPFDLRGLWPPGCGPADFGHCIVEPLEFGQEILGYLITEHTGPAVACYYALGLQLAGTLKLWELDRQRGDHLVHLEGMVAERTATLRSEVRARTAAEAEARAALVERMRLEREVLEISDREQRRIGQELHDDICQRLAAVSLMAAAQDREAAVGRGGGLSARIGEVIDRIKALGRGLFPAVLENQGLAGAIDELTERMRDQTGRQVVFRHDAARAPAPPIPEAHLLHLYRIVQEALNNALRHSGAGRIEVALAEGAEGARLSIRDDGAGFAGPAPAGMGLASMRYRAHMVGADLTIETGDSGTLVTCRLDRRGP